MARRILFVDDEPGVLELLQATFPASAGWETFSASSGEEALAILASAEVDLLVTDQRMPGMTGVELISRARQAHPDLCAIVLSAYTEPQDVVAAINTGQVYRYVVKPWEIRELRRTVEQALERVYLQREREKLVDELERRFAALQVASEIAREVEPAGDHEALVSRLLGKLPGVVPCDRAAALVAPPGRAAVMVLERRGHAGEDSLLSLKEDVLEAWLEGGGHPIAEEDLRLRVVGAFAPDRARGPMLSRLSVPLDLDGIPAGLVLLESAEEDAFGEGDARVLDLLANELAGALRVTAARLGHERRRLERVIECMADGLLYADAVSGDVVANPAARRMLGAPPAEPLTVRWLADTIGFYPFDLVRGLDPAHGPELLAEELHLGERTLSSVISPVTDGEGRLSGVAVALRDVTEQKRLERRKEEFVQVVSHELRTPLTSITGALDYVLKEGERRLEPHWHKMLSLALESTRRLNVLVSDFLDLARAAEGRLAMQVELTDLDELTRTAVERYLPAAQGKGIDLEAATPREPVRIAADPGRLQQVLANLLTNAVKFTGEGGTVRLALFQPAAVPGWVGISSWNNGEEIPEADLERIFEKFEQSRSDRSRRVQGTGLGLAICRTIVESHGGRIWAESAPGQGVRFVLALPPEPSPDSPTVEKHAAPGRPPGAPVLVVDEFEVSAVAKAVLLRKGLPCTAARTREEALRLMASLRPRLVVLDLSARGVEGPALAEALRASPETHETPLLVFGRPEDRERAFALGASAFLGKPATAEQLAGAVEVLLSGTRRAGQKILVVDDDPAIRAVCAEILSNHGYEVHEASSCAEAVQAVRERRPDLLLVDVQLPDGDGFGLLESLAEERALDRFAAVFLSAMGQPADKVRGLRLGAADYLVKPFDAMELVARVDAVLRRKETALAASPLTRLPSGKAIEAEVERRLSARSTFVLCYLDLDDFKAYNDHYGYAKADGVLVQIGDLLRQVVGASGGSSSFVGHVGGDDFVFVTDEDRADEVCRQVIAGFDRLIPLYYDREDRERGFIESEDRFGIRRRFPVMSVSVVSVWAPPGRFEHHADLARAAAEMKKRAKAIPGSIYLRDAPGEGTVVRSA
ncbi:MAG TPA: response regulator [Anaeromyxobacteraceae bacterium]|nr:response regulator [Anaeromyxobacteraceae bacterium]